VIIWRFFQSSHFGVGSFLGEVNFLQNQVSKISVISSVNRFGKLCSVWLVKSASISKVVFQMVKVFGQPAF